MQKILTLLVTLSLVLGVMSISQASLIGDDVTIKYQDPFVVESQTVTVQDGTQDAVDFMLGSLTINMEADTVIVSFNNPTTFADGFFSGLIIDDLNPGMPYLNLADVNVDTNMAGWSTDRLLFYDDMVMFNWAGLTADQSTTFSADLVFDANPVPIPGTMLLFVTGIGGVVIASRRKRKIRTH